VRGHEEGCVDAVWHSRPAGVVVVIVALKLPALDHPGADGVWQLRLCVVKHLLQGNLELPSGLVCSVLAGQSRQNDVQVLLRFEFVARET